MLSMIILKFLREATVTREFCGHLFGTTLFLTLKKECASNPKRPTAVVSSLLTSRQCHMVAVCGPRTGLADPTGLTLVSTGLAACGSASISVLVQVRSISSRVSILAP